MLKDFYHVSATSVRRSIKFWPRPAHHNLVMLATIAFVMAVLLNLVSFACLNPLQTTSWPQPLWIAGEGCCLPDIRQTEEELYYPVQPKPTASVWSTALPKCIDVVLEPF